MLVRALAALAAIVVVVANSGCITPCCYGCGGYDTYAATDEDGAAPAEIGPAVASAE